MKKLALLIVSVMLIALTGCGTGGGDADGNKPVPDTKVNFSLSSFDASNGKIHAVMNLKASKLPKDVKIMLKNFSLTTLNECTLSSFSFNGADDATFNFKYLGSTQVLTIDSDFQCPQDSDLYSNKIMLHYDKWVSNMDGSSKRGPFPKSVSLAGSGGENADGSLNYEIFPPKSLTVDALDSVYEIDVAVAVDDDTGRHPAIDTNVTAEFLQPVFGWIEKYTVKTDSSGTARFVYHSPKNIRGLSDTSLYFYTDTNVRQNTKIIFKPQEGVDRVYLMPQTLQVTKSNEEQNITIVTVNKDNIGVPANIKIEQLYNGDGKDYGKFSTTLVTTDANGKGSFTYTSPSSLYGLDDRTVKLTEEKSGITKDLTITYDQGSIDYQISIDAPKTLSIEQNSTIVVSIHEKGNKDNIIEDENVKNVTLSVKDYYSMINFPDDSIRYSYSVDANKEVDVETKRVSGVAIIEAEATVFNGKRDIKIQTAIPVTIMSGAISSISLNYISTKADADTGLFYDYYNVHAVDKYANPVNNGGHFHPTLICGGNENNATAPATIIPANADTNSSFGEIRKGPEYTIFQDTQNRPFDKVDASRDRLIVLPTADASNKNYIGGWTISNVFGDYELGLEEDYYGKDAKGLRYIVGDEDRLLMGEVHVASVTDANDGQDYTIDGNGVAKIKVAYDPALVSHTYTLAVTAYGENARSATALKDSFRGNDKYNVSDSVVVVPNHGNADTNVSVAIETPGGGSTWLDDVDIVPSSITVNPADKCKLDFNADTTDLHVKRGVFTVNVKADVDDNQTKEVECTVKWNGTNSGIYLEY